jgi:molybdenum cofactor cytidylyltransferase
MCGDDAAFRVGDLPRFDCGGSGIIEEAFEALTGHTLSHPDPFYVERYNHGGMSSGCVCPKFWRDTAVPLLLARHDGSLPGGST